MTLRVVLISLLPLISLVLSYLLLKTQPKYREYLPQSLKTAVLPFLLPSGTYLPPTWDREYRGPKVFTKDDLATKYNGKNGNPAYLVILGEVYDVSGAEHYKEGSGYSVFIGQDATTAFTTGNFDQPPSDDLSRLKPEQMRGIEDWVKFYRNHETYTFVGVLQGKYYNAEGRRTRQWRDVQQRFVEAHQDAARREAEAKILPSCNTRWTSEDGTTVWCEDKMVDDPNGHLVPRKFETPNELRCVCVSHLKATTFPEKFLPYHESCTDTAQTCQFK